MKYIKQLGIGLLAALSISFVGCQKIQNASAQQSAINEEPSAKVEKVEVPKINKPVVSTSNTTETKPKPDRNEFGFASSSSSNKAPAPPLRRDTTPIKKPVTELREKIVDTGSSINTGIQAPKIPAPPIPPPPVINPPAPKPQPKVTNDAIIRLGAANAVPGDNLHVTLPGSFANLGPISIERLDSSGNTLGSPWASGTQMQIPNPNVPGGKIYFKVP